MEFESNTGGVPPQSAARLSVARELHRGKRFAEAEAEFRGILESYPEFAYAAIGLGRLLTDLGRHAEAVSHMEAALRSDSSAMEAHLGKGVAYALLRRYDEAAAAFSDYLRCRPDSAHARLCVGKVHYLRGEPGPAESALRGALELRPGLLEARLYLAKALLQSGKFAEAREFYAARFEPGEGNPNALRLPSVGCRFWCGESLVGKTILVWSEQGFGDEIMVARYAATLKGLGAARVSWVCSTAMTEVFRRMKGLYSVWTEADSSRIPAHDYAVMSMDLPALCGTTADDIPGRLPYLYADAKKVKYWGRTLRVSGMKVGLVWKGRATHPNDTNRSIPSLSVLEPLWRVPGVSFVSLQKGAGADEAIRPSAAQPLVHLGGGIHDFSDTAAIVEGLDLLIGVDTAAVHVAGALGKPVWVLLPFEDPDWRWLLEREDSPWYPGVMRLFRRARSEEWSDVVERVASALAGARRDSAERR